MRPLAAFTIVCAVLALLFWSGGFNFDERGMHLFMFVYLCIGLGGLAAFASKD